MTVNIQLVILPEIMRGSILINYSDDRPSFDKVM